MTYPTQYPEWLKSLGRLRADLGADGRQVRGLPVSHLLTYTGNVTTATLEGAVKSSPDAASELAVFTIGAPSYSAVTNKTTWPFGLSGAQTLALPADGDGNGVVELIFDMVLTPASDVPRRIAGGLFILSGFVTEPA